MDAKAGATIGLSSLNGSEQRWGLPQATFDEHGVALFENVPAGDYVLQYWGGASKRMELRVPCGDVAFQPMKIDALRVVIREESGDLYRLGFRTGDLVIGIDGEEFAEEPNFRVYGELMSSKTATAEFLVRRGSKRLVIPVKGSDLGDWQTMGGSFEPATR